MRVLVCFLCGMITLQLCVRSGSLTRSELVESSGESQWELLSLVDNTQRGSQQRMIEKMKYFPQYSQQSMAGIEMTRMKKQRKSARRAEEERKRALLEKSQAEKEVKPLKAKARDAEKTIQKSEIESDARKLYRRSSQYFATHLQTAKVEIENLRQQLMSQTEKAIEAEKLAKVVEREKERLKADLKNMETSAVIAEAKLSENEAEKAQEIREREHNIPEEREEESDEEGDELEELMKEHEVMRMKLQQAEMKANELQEKLEENERKQREKMTVKVINEEQHIVWEGYGLQLHIPPNSLPEDCCELQLNMTVSRARDCELPDEDGVLVSAVYSFSHNLGERKLRQKATLEMQHCAQGPYHTPLCIVQSDSKVPPHNFYIIQGGKFDSSDRYASIELDHFCSFGVYLAWFFHRNLSTRATLFYINITARSFHFLLYICPDLDAIIRVRCNMLLFIFYFLFLYGQ